MPPHIHPYMMVHPPPPPNHSSLSTIYCMHSVVQEMKRFLKSCIHNKKNAFLCGGAVGTHHPLPRQGDNNHTRTQRTKKADKNYMGNIFFFFPPSIVRRERADGGRKRRAEEEREGKTPRSPSTPSPSLKPHVTTKLTALD